MEQFMKFLKNRMYVILGTLALGILGMIIYKVSVGADAPAAAVLMLVVCAGAAVLVALQQKERKNYMPSHLWTRESMLYLPAVLLLVLDTLITLLQADFLLGLCSLVTTAAFAWTVYCMISRRLPHSYALAALVAASCIRLILCFRGWNVIPRVGSFYYSLFAEILIMLYSYELLTSSVGYGKRRIAIGFCIGACFFAVTAAFSGGFANFCHYAGWVCFLLGELSGLLFKAKKRRPRRKAAPEPEPEYQELPDEDRQYEFAQ